MRDQALVLDVALVDSDVLGAEVEDLEPLARGKRPQSGNADLDHEAAARPEVRCNVLEARDLRVLGRQVADRVEDDVRERERAVDLRRREVADCDLDLLAAGFFVQLGDHLCGEVDPVHADAALRERERDPAGADSELERRPVTGKRGEELDRRIEHVWIEHVRRGLVVALRHVLAEVVLGRQAVRTSAPRGRALPCTGGSTS